MSGSREIKQFSPRSLQRKLRRHPQKRAAESWLAHELQVEMLPVDQIKPNPHNARVHSRAQLDEIAKSIEAVGWTVPILTDERRRMIAGHGRLEAAKLRGLERVPVIRVHGLSEGKKRAL